MKRLLIVLVVGLVLANGIFIAVRRLKPIPEKLSVTPEAGILSGSFDPVKYRPDGEWRRMLTPQQYHILREKGTETPFTGALDKEDRPGTYFSAGCEQPVFRSEQKFDSGTGWPSFWAPMHDEELVLKSDTSDPFESRIEVLDKCGSHLGHVFDDGPTTLPDGRQATGKRYCINSTALYFVPD